MYKFISTGCNEFNLKLQSSFSWCSSCLYSVLAIGLPGEPYSWRTPWSWNFWLLGNRRRDQWSSPLLLTLSQGKAEIYKAQLYKIVKLQTWKQIRHWLNDIFCYYTGVLHWRLKHDWRHSSRYTVNSDKLNQLTLNVGTVLRKFKYITWIYLKWAKLGLPKFK